MRGVVLLEYAWDEAQIVTFRLRLGTETLDLMANVRIEGDLLVLSGLHIQGSSANRVGAGKLLALGRWVRMELGVDELRIEGGTRATGANPGHSPRPIVFR